MRCPYCEGKMRKGQLHAVGAGAGLEWKEGSESLRLNTDPELAAKYEEKYQQFKQIYPACKPLFEIIK